MRTKCLTLKYIIEYFCIYNACAQLDLPFESEGEKIKRKVKFTTFDFALDVTTPTGECSALFEYSTPCMLQKLCAQIW